MGKLKNGSKRLVIQVCLALCPVSGQNEEIGRCCSDGEWKWCHEKIDGNYGQCELYCMKVEYCN